MFVCASQTTDIRLTYSVVKFESRDVGKNWLFPPYMSFKKIGGDWKNSSHDHHPYAMENKQETFPLSYLGKVLGLAFISKLSLIINIF